MARKLATSAERSGTSEPELVHIAVHFDPTELQVVQRVTSGDFTSAPESHPADLAGTTVCATGMPSMKQVADRTH